MQAVAKLPIVLKELKLHMFAQNWQKLIDEACEKDWGYDDYLAALSELEMNDKADKRIKRYLKQSGISPSKTLSSFKFDTNKSISKQKICSLASNTSWVYDANNIVLIGPSGVGKTHLAMAIGHGLIERGIRVLFKSALTLVQELQLAKKQLELTKFISKLNHYHVVIIDDLGYVKKDEVETSALFELISERYEYKSMILTSNQPFSDWDKVFADTAMTIAAIDRIVHHSTIINITGESFRKKESSKRKLKLEASANSSS